MKIIHFCAGLQFWNGMANTARQFIAEEIAQGYESFLTNELVTLLNAKSGDCDIVYIHGAWLPVLWRAAKHAKRINAKLIIRPAGSYDPVRLGYHRWKKKLVTFFERRMLRRADVLLATCEAEAKWIKDYVGEGCPKVEITDLKRFFNLAVSGQWLAVRGGDSLELNHGIHGISGKGGEGSGCRAVHNNKKIHVLYLGRRHPLKGVEYLEKAVKELGVRSQGLGVRDVENNSKQETSNTKHETRSIELKIVSNAFGEELERVWEWCDVLVLPTLSENFGRVVAEALERGKRVITTDGAPAWEEGLELRVGSGGVEELRVESGGVKSGGVKSVGVGSEIWSGYGGQLIYLKGYRDGTDEERVELLKKAIERICK